MKKTLVVLLVLTLSAFLFFGCGEEGETSQAAEEAVDVEETSEKETSADVGDVPKGDYRIGISAVGITHLGDSIFYNSAIDRVKALGGTPVPVEAERKDEKMVSDLENLITSDVDGIVVILGNAKILDPVFKEIRDAGIPLVTVDHASPHSICNSTSNNFSMTVDVALKMASDLEGEGKYAFFWAWDGIRIAEIRKHILEEVLIDYPGIERVGTYPEKIPGTVAAAMTTIENVMVQHQDLDAVFAVWDQPLIGADKAIRAAGKTDEVKCYGIDAPDLLIEMAKPDSSIAAVSSQQYALMASTAVDNLFRYLDGQDVPAQVFLPTKLVTQENVQKVLDDLDIDIE